LNLAYLSIGSNIDPERNLPEAVARLAQYGHIRAVSSVWESAPVGFAQQANFLNAAVLLATELSAEELRAGPIAGIEAALGRVRTENKNAPRPIDIDIMLYNQDILDVGHRHIPDPEIRGRSFVAIPLAEIAPAYIHPETGETLGAIADRFSAARLTMRLRADVRLLPSSLPDGYTTGLHPI
jgi:2-amino-4-hydroxy-6-hydroxymethyldihydropteridine diphosphokinase